MSILNIFTNPKIVWLIIMVVFIIIEILTVQLVTIWFAIGSLSAFIISFYTDNIFIQGVVFLITSIVCLVYSRNIVKKHFNSKLIKTNIDSLIGTQGIVTNRVSKISKGRGKAIDGKDWSIGIHENCLKEEFVEGEPFIVKEIRGVTLVIDDK